MERKNIDYYLLKSIVSARKKSMDLRETTDSFFVAGPSTKPYIKPSFEKILFDSERPTIILISAVGASGKTALAEHLSRETGLPILDLSRHQPVGANALTGLLTQAFDIQDISTVLGGLATGTFGVIIDGVDEGRSKTTKEAFEAFLDDIIRLCPAGNGNTVVILGRSRTVDECWAFLSDRGTSPGLISISPFDVADAKHYIDQFSEFKEAYARQYAEARDFIIEKLGRAFAHTPKDHSEEFLSFIGYPPVLDAISTLLKEEQNYQKLIDDLREEEGTLVEVPLLYRIASYILRREREDKVQPNILQPLLNGVPDEIRAPAMENAYSALEQCCRLVAHCLREPIKLSVIPEQRLNEAYEDALGQFLPEHPFVTGNEFRNAVFEALALATLISSGDTSVEGLINQYLATHKHSYHLVYMLDAASQDRRVAMSELNALLLSALEFRSVHAEVELRVDGPEPDDVAVDSETSNEIDIEIEILIGNVPSKSFSFRSEVSPSTTIVLGPRVASTFMTIPCNLRLGGGHEIDLGAPVEVTARKIIFDAQSLIVRPSREAQDEVIIRCERLESSVQKITANGVNLSIAVEDMAGLAYPVIGHAQKITPLSDDADVLQKYLRLRRILCEFRSHSRGTMARYRKKIEDERVLKNEVGQSVLDKLLSDRIVWIDGQHYILEPDKLNEYLGVSWPQLRKGEMSEALVNYLREIG
jgi:hypothetical protein